MRRYSSESEGNSGKFVGEKRRSSVSRSNERSGDNHNSNVNLFNLLLFLLFYLLTILEFS